MDVREKLVELIIDAKRADPETGSFTEYLADHLITNGVTVQEWISVRDRLPEDWVLCACVDNEVHILCYDYIMDDWDIWGRPNSCYVKPFVTHWMPLPQPPKGE